MSQQRNKEAFEMKIDKDSIIRRKKYKKLEDRIAKYGCGHKCSEWNSGKPVGKELW